MKKNKKKQDKNILQIILISLLFIISLISGMLIRPYVEAKFINFYHNKAVKIESENVYEFSRRTTDFVQIFYNYTNRADYVKSVEDIMDNGGDCYDYANLYVMFAKKAGYGAEKIIITNKTSGHAFTVVYEKEGFDYCILDNDLIVGCI